MRGNRVIAIASLLENASAAALSRLVGMNVLFLISSSTYPLQTEVVLLYARVPYESHGERTQPHAKSCISSNK